MQKVVDWAIKLYKRGTFWGKIFCLGYELCVNSYLQGGTHILASCFLSAYAYKGENINWKFVMCFGFLYLAILFIFSLCNSYAKAHNNSLKQYESAYLAISESLLAEYHKNLDLYSSGNSLSLQELLKKYNETDLFTETCFRVCDAVRTILEQGGNVHYRVITFLRTNIGCDEYHINAFSPLSTEPESYGSSFQIDNYKGVQKKRIPAHARPFINSRCEPVIYIGTTAVRKVYSDYNEKNPTTLHVGVPISINRMVTMSLQITSHDEIRVSESDIRRLVDKVISIFTAYLRVAYMHQIELEQVASKKEAGTQ